LLKATLESEIVNNDTVYAHIVPNVN